MTGCGVHSFLGHGLKQLIVCYLQLTAIAGGGLALTVPVAYGMNGVRGVEVASLAAAICLLGAFGALAVQHSLCRTGHGVAGIMAGTLVRLALPLGVCVVISHLGGVLNDAGLVFYILAFYILTLVGETWIAVRHLPEGRSSVGESFDG